MAGNDVTVKIVGDASGVAPAAQQAESSLGNLGGWAGKLTGMFGELGGKISGAFKDAAAGTEQLAAGMRVAEEATQAESQALSAMIMKVHEGAESVRTFQMRAKEFAEVYVAMFAVEQISQFIEKMAEAAERVKHLSETFGMSTHQVQQLQGMAMATGISVESLVKGMEHLDRNMATAAQGSKQVKQAMDAVGISMNDGRTQMEKLEQVAAKFADMADGPKKVALAMQLFGRSGAELIPILNQGRAGVEALKQKMDELGVTNDRAIERGIALADNVNEAKAAYAGFSNTLMDALAPAFIQLVQLAERMITEMTESYRQGGLMKDVFDALTGTINFAITVFDSLNQVFDEVGRQFSDLCNEIQSEAGETFAQKVPKDVSYTKQAFDTLKNLVVVVKDAILIFCAEAAQGFEEIAEASKTTGEIVYDALTRNWDDIAKVWQQHLDYMAQKTEETKNKVVAAAQEMWAAFKGQQTWKDLPNVALGSDSLFGGIQTSGTTGSGTDYNPHPTGKEKKPKDDLVQRLEQELEEKKTAWEKENVEHGTALQFDLQQEAAFWAAALARTDLSAKDKAAIEKKWIAASQAVQRDNERQMLESYKRDLFNADKNAAEKVAVLQKVAAEEARIHGKTSKEAQAAAFAVAEAERQAAEQRKRIEADVVKAQEALDLGRVDQAQRDAEQEVALGLKTQGQLIAMERTFENQRFQIALQTMMKLRSLIDPLHDPEQYRKMTLQIEALEQAHQNKLTEIDRKAQLQRTQIERQAIGQIASSWGQAIGQMVTLQASFANTIKALWQGLQQAIGNAIAQIVQDWLTKTLSALIIHKAAHAAATKAEIVGDAAKAGAGGTASMAAAPFPMDMTAPGFGAAMFQTAMAYAAIPSGAGGIWNVKEGLTKLHEDEMVLPAWAANPLRNMISTGTLPNAPANDHGHGGQKDRALHVHLHGNLIHNPRQLEKWFRDNWRAVGAGGGQFRRFGGVSNNG